MMKYNPKPIDQVRKWKLISHTPSEALVNIDGQEVLFKKVEILDNHEHYSSTWGMDGYIDGVKKYEAEMEYENGSEILIKIENIHRIK